MKKVAETEIPQPPTPLAPGGREGPNGGGTVVCELRACCKRPATAFYSSPDLPRDTFRNGDVAPVIAVLDEPPPPEEAVGFHESGHAVVFHAYGVPIDSITVSGQAHVDADTMQLPLPERAMPRKPSPLQPPTRSTCPDKAQRRNRRHGVQWPPLSSQKQPALMNKTG